MMELSCISSNQQKIRFDFTFEECDKLIDGIATRLHQTDFLFHKNIQDVFVKLCNLNNYDESINLVADIDKANLKLGDLKVQLGQFHIIVDSKKCYYWKDNQNLSIIKKYGPNLLMS